MMDKLHQWANEELQALSAWSSIKSSNIITFKVVGLMDGSVRWIRNWLYGHAQRVTVHGLMSKRTSVTSGVPQGSILAAVLLNIFISVIDSGIDWTLRKSADGMKSSVDMLDGRDVIQRDLERLKEWAHADLMKFHKAKCKILPMGQGSPHYQYRLED